MMPPGLWNVPMGQWQQFFGQLGMNQMMQMQPRFSVGVQAGAASNSSSGLPVTSQQTQLPQRGPAKAAKKKTQSSSGDSGKRVVEKAGEQVSAPPLDPKYKDVICFNCGEPGHYVGLCSRFKRCFMCGKTGHHMDNCSMWYGPMPTAQFWGSAKRLGFFHIEVEGPSAVQ
jgi:hypothetical protein